MKVLTLFNTIKYLKFSQVYYRILNKINHPKPHFFVASCSDRNDAWVSYPLYEQKLFNDNKVKFLNETGEINSINDWNDEKREKLWLYNLHYFDDLCAVRTEDRQDKQHELIRKWISENPAPIGNGWEPYPLSLRIVNWIKYSLSGVSLEQEILNSLCQQADFLSQILEKHLLGNHLFSNAKALIFAGLYFEGPEASAWLKTGINIFKNELDEQILDDGGNFELTPMYHSIMLIDLLDLYNIFRAYSDHINERLIEHTIKTVIRMITWLQVMTHEDGEISFFNDSAIGIAATPSRIYSYAKLLNISLPEKRKEKLIQLNESGYSRINMGSHSVYFDHAKIGPDYLPGHGHADALSIEWSIGTQRVLVNSGTSVYGISPERMLQRQTKAHNTVVVDGKDSSEVWSGFRVARRAVVTIKEVHEGKDSVKIKAMHNGYLRLKGNVSHTRTILSEHKQLKIFDQLKGQWKIAEAIFHLHPRIQVSRIDAFSVQLLLPGGVIVNVSSNTEIFEKESYWYPEFGRSISNRKLEMKFRSSKLETSFRINGSDF